MKAFSDRIKVTTPKSIIQKDSINSDLMNGLWNGLVHFYWDIILNDWYNSNPPDVQGLWLKVWIHYFKERLDELQENKDRFISKVKAYFFSVKWYEVYNFIEFVKDNYKQDYGNDRNDEFIKYCNHILEKELSAYRFVNGILTPITSNEEIQAIDAALNIDDKYLPVKDHLSNALQYLSDRTNPDYKNSIKESVCAVESICCILTNKPKATLGDALKILEKNHDLHPALKKAFDALYGYTSDKQGIRHGGGLLEKNNLSQDEAIFMHVACCSFVNYLIKKIIV